MGCPMLSIELSVVNLIVIVLATTAIVVCSIGIIIASKFQSKQRKKYNDCLRIIKEKENSTIQIKNGLSKEEINQIDQDLNVDNLMTDLYHKYIELENKVRLEDNNLDRLLIGHIKDLYTNKIEVSKAKNYVEINDGIDLINYSIIEFSKELKFRITVNCFNYKKSNDMIVSGSNFEKVEQVIILTFENHNQDWLISKYEKVYEKKLQS